MSDAGLSPGEGGRERGREARRTTTKFMFLRGYCSLDSSYKDTDPFHLCLKLGKRALNLIRS